MIPRVSGGAVRAPFAILPLGAASETRLLLAARGVRAVGEPCATRSRGLLASSDEIRRWPRATALSSEPMEAMLLPCSRLAASATLARGLRSSVSSRDLLMPSDRAMLGAR